MRRIQAKATERQQAWLATGQPNVTERLTRDLDELFDGRRRDFVDDRSESTDG